MKLGIIRCAQTEDICPATTDLVFIKRKKGAFAHADGEIKLVGLVGCGGCPGKRAVMRAAEMVKRGADTIALASCITKGTPIGFACPNAETMKSALAKKLGPDIKILDYTH
ncbi:MAG: CGGC domain-containing protein [Syntrophomonadaceae bacterium]|nr:CGGC domain-containing protein [Syntrophomonadaceae bacterium]